MTETTSPMHHEAAPSTPAARPVSCAACSGSFVPKKRWQRFCSRKCRADWHQWTKTVREARELVRLALEQKDWPYDPYQWCQRARKAAKVQRYLKARAAGARRAGQREPTRSTTRRDPRGAAPGRVVHCKREAFDVYIGRPSPFGNPWRVMGEQTRQAAIEQFEAYARARIANSPKFRDAVKALHGKTLGCWCAPKACHGDVLLKLAAELVSAGSDRTGR